MVALSWLKAKGVGVIGLKQVETDSDVDLYGVAVYL